MNIVATEDLIREFGAFGIRLSEKDHDQLIDRFRNYSVLFDKDAESLVESWLAFCAGRGYNNIPTESTVEIFERHEHETAKKKAQKDISSNRASSGKNIKPSIFKTQITLDDDILGDYSPGSTFARHKKASEKVPTIETSSTDEQPTKIKEEPQDYDYSQALDMSESQPSSSQKDTSMKIGRGTPDLLVNVKAEPTEDESMLEVKIEPQVDDDQAEQDVEMTDAKKEIVDGIKRDPDIVQESVTFSSQLSDVIPCAFGLAYEEPENDRTKTNPYKKGETYGWKQLLEHELSNSKISLYPRWIDCREAICSALDDVAQKVEQEWASLFVDYGEDRYYIGRVVNDKIQPKLTYDTLTFVASSLSNCKQVRLDIEKLEKYSFFSGQILGLKGKKTDKIISVSEMIDPKTFMLPFSSEPPGLINEKLDIYVAAGPFFVDPFGEKFEFKIFIDQIKEAEPDFVILIGPFFHIDSENIINSNSSISELFNTFVAELEGQLIGTKTQAFLIPSPHEAHHHNLYPTPAFTYPHDPHGDVKYENLSKVSLLPNPSVINIHGVIIGLTSVDTILELSRAEISHGMSDRMTRLCEHVVTQRNFYPVYPPSSYLTVDYTRIDMGSFPGVTPHILILPSDLRHFIKDVHGCVCINPERLIKHQKRGFYSRIQIRSPSDGKMSAGVSLKNHVAAQIVKI